LLQVLAKLTPDQRAKLWAGGRDQGPGPCHRDWARRLTLRAATGGGDGPVPRRRPL